MSTSDDYDPLDEAADEVAHENGRASHWPKLPGFDPSLRDIRHYLTTGAGLPRGWSVDLVDRHGPHPSDPMTVLINVAGQNRPVRVRFEAAREASKPGALRSTFMEATRGMARMRYPKPAQASDYHAMLCALAHVSEDRSIADETTDWLQEYVETAVVLTLDLDAEHRYDTLMALRRRGEFDTRRVRAWISGTLAEGQQHVVIVDGDDRCWVRASELVTWVRHMRGVSIAQHALDARLAEVDVERVPLEVDNRHKGFGKVRLILYRFPSDPAFPIPTRIHKG